MFLQFAGDAKVASVPMSLSLALEIVVGKNPLSWDTEHVTSRWPQITYPKSPLYIHLLIRPKGRMNDFVACELTTLAGSARNSSIA